MSLQIPRESSPVSSEIPDPLQRSRDDLDIIFIVQHFFRELIVADEHGFPRQEIETKDRPIEVSELQDGTREEGRINVRKIAQEAIAHILVSP